MSRRESKSSRPQSKTIEILLGDLDRTFWVIFKAGKIGLFGHKAGVNSGPMLFATEDTAQEFGQMVGYGDIELIHFEDAIDMAKRMGEPCLWIRGKAHTDLYQITLRDLPNAA